MAEAVTAGGPEVVSAKRSGDSGVGDPTTLPGRRRSPGRAPVRPRDRLRAVRRGSACRWAGADGRIDGATGWCSPGPATPMASKVTLHAWADSPVFNLFDAAGLPAGPFGFRFRSVRASRRRP
ncbi:hypothetical protein ACRAWD_28160 [Caulobacter segnis]